MGPDALKAFLHEYRIAFPVAVDRPIGAGLPATMSRLGLRGTPSLLLVDRAGDIRLQQLGQIDDLALGAMVGHLLTD